MVELQNFVHCKNINIYTNIKRIKTYHAVNAYGLNFEPGSPEPVCRRRQRGDQVNVPLDQLT